MTHRTQSVAEAAEILREGGLVAFPTETVFGLGADATNPAAIERLYEAKGRPSDNPLIVHLGDWSNWALAASEATPTAEALMAAFAPGPLTVVLPKRETISTLVTGGLDTVGLRIPSHSIACEILRLANIPVAAPSANRSGRPSGTTWQSVLEDLDGRIDAIYCDDAASIGIESTVVDCCGSQPVVLRPGATSIEQLRTICPDARELDAGDSKLERVKSPGILHPHYRPTAAVYLLESTSLPAADPAKTAFCGLEPIPNAEDLAYVELYDSLDDYAAGYYEFLREADRRAIPNILVQAAPADGIGRALLDRQRRSAAG